MKEKISKYIFDKKAQKYLSEQERTRKFVNYVSAKTVFVLFQSDVEEKNAEIHDIIRLLKEDGKKVTAWGYINKKEITTSVMRDFRILGQKHFNLISIPNPELVNELQTMSFDLLIDLSVKPIVALQYLCLNTNALCKSGLRTTELPILDFMIEINNQEDLDETNPSQPYDEMYIFNQIFFYLKKIQTND